MYKVVLVDDEQFDLEGLHHFVPWSSLNMEVVATFRDAFSALEYIEQHNIDILVSDIRMPIMSGLDLAEQALVIQCNLKIVFITGYEDFHYAKKAISMNASSYVLKPVDDDELLEVLRKIERNLTSVKQQYNMVQTMEHSMVYVKQELLRRCFMGANEPQMFENLQQQYDSLVHVVIIEIDDVKWKLSSYSDEEKTILTEQLYQYLIEIGSIMKIENYCQMEQVKFAFVIPTLLVDQLANWIHEVQLKFKLSITIGVGAPVINLVQLHESYQQANQALGMKINRGKGMVLRYEEKDECSQQLSYNLDNKMHQLFKAISNYDLVGIVDVMDDIFLHAHQLKQQITVYHYSLYIVNKVEHYLIERNENMHEMLNMDWDHWSIIMQFETIEDINSWFRKKIFEISETLHNKKMRKNMKLVQEIQAHVMLKIFENISLKEVAQHFSFSPNYLGQLFRAELGEGFNEYVTSVRMEKAKQLLRDPKVKIYEVAHMIGYKDLTYFSKQFKEFTGLTAGDYRKQC
ncbi:response regulator [Paenibacillus endoradicis]|uniref:response regulator n=1 Tax=Paenibacillus endoradicis TaxID=2972487 RepID=UPI0021594BCD|nr:response regulator [Paenibacillus endoradicis]MCR8657227.1 response regulator [Paenibacillus endoradicis]